MDISKNDIFLVSFGYSIDRGSRYNRHRVQSPLGGQDMEKRWMLLLDCYEGLVQKAADMLYGALAGQVKYVLPTKIAKDATQADLAENHIVLLGRSCANALLQSAMTGAW